MDASCFAERLARRSILVGRTSGPSPMGRTGGSSYGRGNHFSLPILLAVLICTNAAFAAAPLPSLVAPPSGTLFIVGGGVIGDDVMGQFFKLTGEDKGRLVIITTASYRAETAPFEIIAM